jgi:predicted nucleic acid-binding protein
VFIDSNIWGYTVDTRDPTKQQNAQSIVSSVIENDIAVISTQVLQEFYNVATTKLNVDTLLAKSIVHNLRNLETVQITPDIIEAGIDISIASQISFWDGLILAAAEIARCSIVFSEDLNDGQIIRGVKIVNPFKLTDFA